MAIAIDTYSALGAQVRGFFPIFAHGGTKNLAYLDTAATAQKPKEVIERLTQFLTSENANIHRGAYRLSGEATDNFEGARSLVAQFLKAKDPEEIIFTRGTTDSINLAASILAPRVFKGDTIPVSLLEHHSNFVPWQRLAQARGAHFIAVEISDAGILDLNDFEKKVREYRPKIVAITHTSNALGTIVPIATLSPLVHSYGGIFVVDGAQSSAHGEVNVQELGCDLFAFSGHKLYGPTGVGVLWGKKEILESGEPAQGGGGMIATVSLEKTTWAPSPHRYEAGTPPIAEVIALGTALTFVESIGRSSIAHHEEELVRYAFEELKKEDKVKLYGPLTAGAHQAGILSFSIQGIHPHDFSTVADSLNVQVRAGHHCVMPLLKRLGAQSTIRMSLGMYSTKEDVDQLVESVRAAKKRLL